MNKNMKSEGAVCGTTECREPKYQYLIQSAGEVQSLVNHLENFMVEIGLPSEAEPCDEPKKQHAEPSLVVALNVIPQEINESCAKAHDIINRISDALN